MTASRTPTLLALGVVAVVAFFSIVAGALAILDEVSQDEVTTTRSLGEVRSIDLSADDGDVEIRTTSSRTATLRIVEEHGLFGGPDVNVSDANGRIDLSSDCFALVFGNSCSVKWILTVPRGTPIRAQTGSGDVDLNDVEGAIGIETGSGDIDVRRAASTTLRLDTNSGDIKGAGVRARELTLRTGSGDIELPGLSTREATLDTGSGDIEVLAASAFDRLVAEAGSGDVTIAAPGGPYAVSTETGSGDEDISIATDPDAPRRMTLKTGSGDVEVRGR
jgi:hypothetical protein